MSARLRALVDEYHQKIERRKQLDKRTKQILSDWNSSLKGKLEKKMDSKAKGKQQHYLGNKSSTESTNRVSLQDLSRDLAVTQVREPLGLSGGSRFLSMKSLNSKVISREIFPKIRSKSQQMLGKGPQHPTAKPQKRNLTFSNPQTPPTLKFKLISKSTHSIEQLFPLPSVPPKLRRKGALSRLSNPPKKQQLSDMAKELFNSGNRVMCAIKKFANTLRANYTYFKIPFDLTEGQARTQFKMFMQRVRNLFDMNENRPVFLFDSEGSPVTDLSGFLKESNIVLVSNLPKLEFTIDYEVRKYLSQHDLAMKMALVYANIHMDQFLADNRMRLEQKVNYIQNLCVDEKASVIENQYKNKQIIEQCEKICAIYQKHPVIEEQNQPDKNKIKMFINISPTKKEFTNQQLQTVKNIRQQIIEKNKDKSTILNRSINSLSPPKLSPSKPAYPINHRDMLKQMNASVTHDFMIKTKFNRQQVIKIKSIFQSILAMNLKANKELKSIPKQVLIKALHSFGFDASTNLLNEILKFEEFIDWPRFVSLMETLIHKNSAQSLDQYICSLGKSIDASDGLNFQQIVKIIRFGLQRLIIFKDSFYDGYEMLFSRQLFKEMGVPLNGIIQVDALKKFLNMNRKHKTFEYIFFE